MRISLLAAGFVLLFGTELVLNAVTINWNPTQAPIMATPDPKSPLLTESEPGVLNVFTFKRAIELYYETQLDGKHLWQIPPAIDKESEGCRLQIPGSKEGGTSPGTDPARHAFLAAKGSKLLEIGALFAIDMVEWGKNPAGAYSYNDLYFYNALFGARMFQEAIKMGMVNLDEKAASERVIFIVGNMLRPYNTVNVFGDKSEQVEANVNLLSQPGSYDKILVARVLHFGDGDFLEENIKNLQALAAMDGQVFVVAATMFNKPIAPLLPKYFSATKDERYPGYIGPTLAQILSLAATDKGVKNAHMLDPAVLGALFIQYGFMQIKAGFSQIPHRSDSYEFRNLAGMSGYEPYKGMENCWGIYKKIMNDVGEAASPIYAEFFDFDNKTTLTIAGKEEEKAYELPTPRHPPVPRIPLEGAFPYQEALTRIIESDSGI